MKENKNIKKFTELTKKSTSQLAKSYLSALIKNKEKVYVYENDTEYRGSHLLDKICKTVLFFNEIIESDQTALVMKSSNSTEWICTYIAGKIQNLKIFVLAEENQQAFKKICQNFPYLLVFENNKISLEYKNSQTIPGVTCEIDNFGLFDCIFTSGSIENQRELLLVKILYSYGQKY